MDRDDKPITFFFLIFSENRVDHFFMNCQVLFCFWNNVKKKKYFKLFTTEFLNNTC